MECPHLSDFDKLTASPNLRTILTTTTLKQAPPDDKPTPVRGTRSSKAQAVQPHQCQVCKSDRSPWMCVLCGQVHCGRYVNSHARKHFLNDNQHFLAICCTSRAAFCYACDEYVMNETQSKCILRALEQLQNNNQAPSNKTNNNITSSNNINSGATHSNSKRKEPQRDEVGLSPSTKDNTLKAKRMKLAGIRNLGNTCYMNSVLQCLSHIQRFTSSVEEPDPSVKVDLSHVGSTTTTTTTNGGSVATTHKRKLMQLASMNDNSKPELLIETLRNTIYLLKKSGKSCIIPENLFTMICRNPRFRGYQQQDAHEFLRYVLDRLDKECLENYPASFSDKLTTTNTRGDELTSGAKRARKGQAPKSRASIIGNIFGGLLQNEVNCLECGFKYHKQDPFMDLSLDIPVPPRSSGGGVSKGTVTMPSSNGSDNSNTSTASSSNHDSVKSSGGGSSCHLIDCLSSFIELEELTETELYYCSNCKQRQRSTKRFWIRKLPDVLCLHLKRFRYNNFIRTKIDEHIQFPIRDLDMKRFVMANKHETRGSSCGPTTYDLVAFIEHHGSGVGSGHYTAFCRHEDCWFHFDDSLVSACDETRVSKSKAYILFYNRRSS